MNMAETKSGIVDEFLRFKGLRDVVQLDKFINRIEVAMGNGTSPDPDLLYIVTTLRAVYEECTTSDFLKCKTVAEPIFIWLNNKADWSFANIAILKIVICYTNTYKLAHTLAQKALEALKYNYATEKYQRDIIYTIYFNMTFRLLRAKYYDIENPEEQKVEIDKIQDLFGQYLGLSREMVPSTTQHIAPMMLNIREALFNNDCDGIVKHLEALRRFADKPTYLAMRLEVIEHLGSKIQNLTNPLYNLLVGSRIQYYRRQKLKSTKELAQYLGTSVTVVNNIESGWRGASPERLFSIAKFLDVEIENLNGHSRTTKFVDAADPYLEDMKKIFDKLTDKSKEFIVDVAKKHSKFVGVSQNSDDDSTDNEE